MSIGREIIGFGGPVSSSQGINVVDAIDCISTRGLTKGNLEADDGSVCMLGALFQANGGQVQLDLLQRIAQRILPGTSRDPIEVIAEYNDDPNTSQEDAILILKHVLETE